MTRVVVDQLVELLDEAFEGIGLARASFLANLASVTEDDWLWVPPGGARMIRTITGHTGGAALLYYDRVFGNCQRFGDPITSWNTPAGDLGVGTEQLDSTTLLANEPPMAAVVAWATEQARAIRNATAELSDDSLDDIRADHWQQPHPIRWFISVMIQHYTYHAGEINHIRALRNGDDG